MTISLCCEMGLLDAMLTSLANTPSVTSLKKPYGKWFLLKCFTWKMLHKHDLPCQSSILPFFSIIPAAFYIVIKLRLTERSSVWRLFIKAIIFLSKRNVNTDKVCNFCHRGNKATITLQMQMMVNFLIHSVYQDLVIPCVVFWSDSEAASGKLLEI